MSTFLVQKLSKIKSRKSNENHGDEKSGSRVGVTKIKNQTPPRTVVFDGVLCFKDAKMNNYSILTEEYVMATDF